MSKPIISKILSAVLAVTLLTSSLTGITAFANGSTSVATNPVTSGGGSKGNADDPMLNPPGVMVRINTVSNTVTEADAKKITDHNKANPSVPWNYAMASTVDARLYELPVEMLQHEVMDDTALIYTKDGKAVQGLNCLVNNEKDCNPIWIFRFVYIATKNGVVCTEYRPTGAGNYIMKDSTLFKKFKDCKLTWTDIKSVWNKEEIKASAFQFVYLWSKPETVSIQLNKMFYETGEDAYYKNMLHYLDFLLAVWYLQGETKDPQEKIEAFLKNLNQDGTGVSEYTIVDMVTVANGAQFNKEAWPNRWPVYTLPTWYSVTNTESTDAFRGVTAFGNGGVKAVDQVKQADKSYAGNPVGWEKDVYTRYQSIGRIVKEGNWERHSGSNRSLEWWSANVAPVSGWTNKQAALMCLPTDMWGDATGGVGYTYFTTGYMIGGQTVTTNTNTVLGQFTLTASSEVFEVYAPNTKVDADMFISIKQNTSDYNKIEKLFRDQATKGNGKAKVIIDLGVEKLQGSAESNAVVDAVRTPSSGTVINGSNQVVWSNVTFDLIKPYIKGSYNFHLIDSLINIKENSTNRYKASVKLVFDDNTTITFEAKGAIVINKTTAADDVEWQLVELKDQSAQYYSVAKTPKAEIKEGSPGNESFEAMAGVPTTEDLYVGFGATEFMTNMKCELKVSPQSERVYNLTYTTTNCAEDNEFCEYSCPGHTVTAAGGHVIGQNEDGTPKYCDSGTATGYCDKGPVTITAKCSCGQNEVTETFTPTYGAGYKECLAKDGTGAVYKGMGCVHTQKVNKCHTHTHTFTGKVTQPIGTFNYMDITDLKLWKLNEAKLEGNPELFSNPNQTVDPETGYMTYYDQEEYEDNNGRLRFSYTLNEDKNEWGNTKGSKTDSKVMLHSECDVAATDWMNEQVNKNVIAEVISDYEVLATTEGFQAIAYHKYNSNSTPITNNVFVTGTDSKSIAGEMITFPTKNWDDFWNNNYTTGRVIGVGGITFSGYNGDYDSPETKYINNNTINGRSFDTTLSNQPNSDWDNTYEGFVEGFSNLRLTRTGLNVIDSTDTTTKEWSPDDSIEPVSNGEWDTGHCYVSLPLVVNFNSPGGKDHGDKYTEEAIYTNGKTKVNDIVIHNPVSTQEAIVISNDKKYDLRTEESLAEGGDPVRQDNGCPGDSTCDYQKLICTLSPTPHTDDCYNEVSVVENFCTGVLNSHVHTEECFKQVSQTFNYTGGEQVFTAPYTGEYTLEVWGAAGAGRGEYSETPGGYSKGTVSLTAGQKIIIVVGGAGTGTGYNGGGRYSSTLSGGGGATHIAKDFAVGEKTPGTIAYGSFSTATPYCWRQMKSSCSKYRDYAYSSSPTSPPSSWCHNTGWVRMPEYDYNSVLLKDYNDEQSDIYIVAGGGGSAGIDGPGGIGGGLEGGDSLLDGTSSGELWIDTGGTQTEEGTEGSGGHFGIGGAGLKTGGYGGGGWYGGNGGGWYYRNPNIDITLERRVGGGGGSGYIGGVSNGVTTAGAGAATGDGWAKVTYNGGCNGELNAHTHTDSCFKETKQKVLTCDDPHHYEKGKPYDPNSLAMHWSYGDSRCWAPCMDDKNHKNFNEVTLGNGQVVSMNDTFINLDREFKIYYPNVGDFAGQPTLHGILDTTSVRGMGYTDNMDVSKWTRNRTVTFSFHVIDANGKLWGANEHIPLDDLPNEDNVYTFYCVLANNEEMNGSAIFNSIATNAREVEYYSDNENVTNKERNTVSKEAKHTAYKKQYIDVVGSIGSVTINDTEDFRFSNLFKAVNPNEWLIPNILHKVYLNVPNMLVSGKTNVRGDIANESTNWQSAYGITTAKNKQFIELPLTPSKNNVEIFKDEPLRPGYNLLMDIETIGNYYGENRNPENDEHQDSNLYYKMQITPRYWALNLTTGEYTPVDVYEQDRGAYKIVNRFDEVKDLTEFYLYLDWLNESGRRNYTTGEKEVSENVVVGLSGLNTIKSRIPSAGRDVLGHAGRLFLNDVNRTFVGSSLTYGVDKNPGDRIDEYDYQVQGQRWHFSLGLPSSSVFVPRNTECTTESIKTVGNDNYVIVCTADFKVKGSIWALQYNANGLNNSEPFKVFEDGREYDPPKEPDTGKTTTDVIISVFSPDKTATLDMTTAGSH